jgi:hypothetical protein
VELEFPSAIAITSPAIKAASCEVGNLMCCAVSGQFKRFIILRRESHLWLIKLFEATHRQIPDEFRKKSLNSLLGPVLAVKLLTPMFWGVSSASFGSNQNERQAKVLAARRSGRAVRSSEIKMNWRSVVGSSDI